MSSESDSSSEGYEVRLLSNIISNEEEDQDDNNSNEINEHGSSFDTNLPTTHSYLGRLDSVGGYTVFDDYDEISLLAIFTDSLVLPGFTLPLVITHYLEQDTIKMYLAESKTLGLVFSDNSDPSLMFNYGVTMEVFESYSQGSNFHLKAKGRQRFMVIGADKSQSSFSEARLKKLNVRILPEPDNKSPLADTQLLSLNRWRTPVNDYESQMKNKLYRRYDTMQYTFPLWLYDAYEIYYYVNEIKKAFNKVNIHVPTDPIKLSYWFLQNFQLEHGERLEVLKLDSAAQRLRLELCYLRQKRVLCCKNCSQEIADQEHVFPMSKEGIQSNYCNPGGYVYETLTVSKARYINCIGRPSTEFSWFPGYAWTIAKCRSCHSQLGWKFTASSLIPNLFWGLAKNCIKIKIIMPKEE